MERCVAFAVVLAVCTPSLAAQTEIRKVGLGISLLGSSGIFIPIALSARLRLEPTLSFSTFATTINFGGSSQDQEGTTIALGVGLLLLHDIGPDTKAYLGPRGGLAWSKSSTTPSGGQETESEQTSWFLSVAAGAEHFLGERFSLGGEAVISYRHDGEPQGSTSGISSQSTRFNTSAIALVRWYP